MNRAFGASRLGGRSLPAGSDLLRGRGNNEHQVIPSGLLTFLSNNLENG